MSLVDFVATIKFQNVTAFTGSPIHLRLKAFQAYFTARGFQFVDDNPEYTFISMPPFRNFWIFLNPTTKIILDIRDGWSIAQESGYGGTTKSKSFKAKITRLIELFMIRRAHKTITCTNGLQEYLQKISGKEVLLIPNGVLDEDYDLAKKLLNKQTKRREELVFCCAGQFSEYGIDKVKKLCQVILQRYHNKKIKIQLIGTNKEKNNWIANYLNEASNGRANLEILPRMNRKELYSTMIKANYGMTILRDPAYDFGTKVYDYIALGLPVINYFDEPNNFTNYFDACLDVPFRKKAAVPEIRRSLLITKVFDKYKF